MVSKSRVNPDNALSKHVSPVSSAIVRSIHPPFPFRLSILAKNYLLEMARRIHSSAKTIRHIPIVFDSMDFSAKTDHGVLYHHIPEPIRKTIESRPKIGRKYTFSVGDTTHAQKQVAVYLVLPKPKSPDDPYSRIYHSEKLAHRFFESSIRRMRIWLGVAFRFGGHLCAQKLNVYVFLTDHQKRLPNSHEEDASIGIQHANTALTTSCSQDSNIYLFRSEEWFKVFIHETFHSLGIDFSQMDVSESNRQITQMFLGCDPHLDVRLFETYCEMWAEILNVLMISYFSKVDGDVFPKYSGVGQTKRKTPKSQKDQKKKSRNRRTATPDFSKIVSDAERHLQYERTFTMIQAGKVLKHHGMTYRDLCSGTLHMPKYRESTNVFAYYILKSILMYHLNEFIEWCAKHTGSRETPTLFFPKSPESVREYGHLIGRLYQSDEFIKTLEDAHAVENGDTLRMSVFEH